MKILTHMRHICICLSSREFCGQNQRVDVHSTTIYSALYGRSFTNTWEMMGLVCICRLFSILHFTLIHADPRHDRFHAFNSVPDKLCHDGFDFFISSMQILVMIDLKSWMWSRTSSVTIVSLFLISSLQSLVMKNAMHVTDPWKPLLWSIWCLQFVCWNFFHDYCNFCKSCSEKLFHDWLRSIRISSFSLIQFVCERFFLSGLS